MPIFFALSGFLITLRYLDTIQQGKFNFYEYMSRRFARIYPLYFFILTYSVLHPSEAKDIIGGNSQLVAHYTVMQSFFHRYNFLLNPAAWSLTVEESFYLIAPLVYLSLAYGMRNQPLWKHLLILGMWVLGMYAAGLLLIQFSHETGLAQDGGEFMHNIQHVMLYTIFGNFFHFAAGMVAAVLYMKTDVKHYLHTSQGGWVALIGGLLAIGGILLVMYSQNLAGGSVDNPQHYERGLYGVPIYNYAVGALTSLLMLCLTAPGTWLYRLLSLSPLVYMGRISYALYLVQLTPMVNFLITATQDMGWWRVPALYLGMNLLCVVLYEVVEHPAHKIVLHNLKQIGGWLNLKPRSSVQKSISPG